MATERVVTVYGDGVTDDTEALQAILNGEAIGIRPDGRPWDSGGARISISRALVILNKLGTALDTKDATLCFPDKPAGTTS